MKDAIRVKIIGLGGIGSWLAEPLARLLAYNYKDVKITFIDGDTYEDKNRCRQRVGEIGNKADSTAKDLTSKVPNVSFYSQPKYVTADNVIFLIREGDVVFLCVDNDATRHTISQRCEELDNVVLFSGGNDYTDGNVIVHVRKDGANITRPITEVCKRIGNPKDKNPGEVEMNREGCQEQAEEFPQLVATNFSAAAHMLNCFYAHEQGKLFFEQVYFDIASQKSRPSPDNNVFNFEE